MSKTELEEISNELEELHEIFDIDFDTLTVIRGKNMDIKKHFDSTNEINFSKESHDIQNLFDNIHKSIDDSLDILYENVEKLRETNLNKNELGKVSSTLNDIYWIWNRDFEKIMIINDKVLNMNEHFHITNQTEFWKLSLDMEMFLYYVAENMGRGFDTLKKSKNKLIEAPTEIAPVKNGLLDRLFNKQ